MSPSPSMRPARVLARGRRSGTIASRAAFCAALLGCGSDESTSPSTCSLPAASPKVIDISAAPNRMMALFSDGSVRCWGSNNMGGCALGSPLKYEQSIGYLTPVRSRELSCMTQVDAAGSVGVNASGEVVYWGGGLRGQRGSGVRAPDGVATIVRDVPLAIAANGDGPTNAIYAMVGQRPPFVWGSLPDDERALTDVPIPRPVAGVPSGVKARVAAASCLLDTEGTVWCAGWNDYGALGDGTLISRTDPIRVPLPEAAVDVDIDAYTGCAVLVSGQVWCWGSNAIGRLGRGDLSLPEVTVPAPVAVELDAVRVTVGYETACAISRDGALSCWGDPVLPIDPSGNADYLLVPTTLPEFGQVRQVALPSNTICVLRVDQTVWCRGLLSGRIGNDSYGLGQVDFSQTLEVEPIGKE